MTATNGDSTTSSPPVPRAESPTGSPRSASISLQAAAAMNAGLQREPSSYSSTGSFPRSMASPQAGRRRSTILMNLQLNDPSVPAPGEMLHEQHSGHLISSPQPLSASPRTADPNHHRAPSLGELHQELEAEQEAHVNRLLQMIRQQQLELQRLQANQAHHSQSSTGDDTTSASERPSSHATTQPITSPHSTSQHVPSLSGSYSRSPIFPHHRSSMEMARADIQRRSRTPSRNASPRLRSTSISAESGGDWVLGGRDENAFYQAETQMLTRENQMLRHRIRELEKQVSELSAGSTVPNEPSVPSNLIRSETTTEESDTVPKDA